MNFVIQICEFEHRKEHSAHRNSIYWSSFKKFFLSRIFNIIISISEFIYCGFFGQSEYIIFVSWADIRTAAAKTSITGLVTEILYNATLSHFLLFVNSWNVFITEVRCEVFSTCCTYFSTGSIFLVYCFITLLWKNQYLNFQRKTLRHLE